MKVSKGVKTHLSTDKVQQSFEKSTKERKKSKNLYTLNKQSEDEQSIGTSQFDRNLQSQKHQRKSRNVSYHHEYQSQSQSDDDTECKKNQSKKQYNVRLNNELDNHSDHDSQDSNQQNELNSQQTNQERIKRYSPSLQNDKESLRWRMTIKHLQQQNQLLNNSLLAHQNRQKEMVGKLAKLQSQNKKLQYEIVRISKSQKQKKIEEDLIKKTKQQVQSMKKINEQMLGFVESQNMRILTYIKALITKLVSQGNTQQENLSKQNQSIATYLQKCLSALKQNRKTIFKKFSFINQASKENVPNNIQSQKQKSSLNFDFSYERQRIVQLNEQNSKLSSQLKKIKEQFNKLSQSYKKSTSEKQNQFKQEKKQLCEKYNQAIEELKTKYNTLESKIQEQEERYQLKIQQLEKTLGFKQKVVKKLKQQLREMNIKLDEVEEERFELLKNSMSRKSPPYQSKNKYIDGDFLNQTINSNKEKSLSKDRSFNKDNSHEESFYEYQPQRRRRRKEDQLSDTMMRKSHKNKKHIQLQASRKEEEDLQKINRQIQELQRQILSEFQNQA